MTALTAALSTEVLLDPMLSCPDWLKSSLEKLNISDPRHPTILEQDAPTADQFRELAASLPIWRSLLAPARVDEVATCVGIVHAGLRKQKSDDETESAGAEVFMMVLQGLPAFALQEAARRIVMGDAGLSKTFVPTPAEMRGVALSLMGNARWYAKQIELLLAAEIERDITEDEHARISARFDALLSGFVGKGRKLTHAA